MRRSRSSEASSLICGSGSWFGEEEAGFAAADQIEMAVVVEVCGYDLHAAAHAAAVVDHVADPFEAAVARALRSVGRGGDFAVLVPVEADGLAFAGVVAVVGEVALAGDEV